jgi:hypothetical protein
MAIWIAACGGSSSVPSSALPSWVSLMTYVRKIRFTSLDPAML